MSEPAPDPICRIQPPGALRGRVHMSDDFDEPLTGFDQPISPAEPQERLGDGARLARLAEKLRPSD